MSRYDDVKAMSAEEFKASILREERERNRNFVARFYTEAFLFGFTVGVCLMLLVGYWLISLKG